MHKPFATSGQIRLLAALGLAAIAMSQPLGATRAGVDDPAAVAALRALGVERMTLDENGDVDYVELSGPRITGEALQIVARLPNLSDLSISSAPVTDADLAHLESMGTLRRLTISRCQRVTDAGIAHLKKLADLEYLGLLYLPSLTDAGLAHVKGLTNLEMLELNQTRITDEGLKALAGLRDLERLYIYDTAITGEGLEHLRGLAKLEILLLRGTRLNDAGLRHLEGMTGLRELVLTDTTSDSYTAEVTAAGVARLKEALHDCKISR